MPARLDSTDIRIVDEALAELQAQDPPTDRGPLGCVLSLPAFLILLVVPVLGRNYGLSSSVATPLIIGGIVLLVVGLTLWFTAGGFVRGHHTAAAEAALRTLDSWDAGTEHQPGEREEVLRACTLLLKNACAGSGPTTTETYSVPEARERLGAALPLVEAVEARLLEKGVIYPVFTDSPEEETQGADGEQE